MNIKRNGSTPKQLAYARRVFGAKGRSKKAIALDVGYGKNVAASVTQHIENKPGFHNAMIALALESNNLALAALHEYQKRGFGDFTNNELTSALNAIAGAWTKFNRIPETTPPPGGGTERTDLRTVILQQVENQTIENPLRKSFEEQVHEGGPANEEKLESKEEESF